MPLQEGGGEDAESLVRIVISCHHKLSRMQSLHPAPEVNAIFERLVDTCSQVTDAGEVEKVGWPHAPHRVRSLPPRLRLEQVLNDPRIIRVVPSLRQLCSEGEFLLEGHWANKVSACKTTEDGKTGKNGSVLKSVVLIK